MGCTRFDVINEAKFISETLMEGLMASNFPDGNNYDSKYEDGIN